MKYQLKKILTIEIIVFVFALINLYNHLNKYLFLVLLSLITFIVCKLVNIDDRNERFQKDYILYITIGILSYYIIEYFLGFFVGFLYSTYSRRIFGILNNILTSIIYITALEILRERIVKSGRYYKTTLVLSMIIFTLLELVGIFNTNIFQTKSLLLQFILSIVIPTFLKNLMLSILCLYSNKNVTILYQLLMTIPNYILGVFPDLGDYINSTFQTIFPLIILFFILKIHDVKKEKITNGRIIVKRKYLSVIVGVICLFFTSILIYLVSGFGKYYIMAIGSGSMTNTINKGDAVIVAKNSSDYQKGQVIAFKMEGKVIVHRIVGVQITGKGTFYKTKGDYNESEDGWLLTEEKIIGRCILRVPFIGWPSVALSELISG